MYLDTEVRDGLPRLAERMVNSGLSPHELRVLWRQQVTPCVHRNLKVTAGEWAGFDREWLLARVARRAQRPGLESLPIVGPLVHRFRAHGAEREFALALELSARLRRVPAAQRERRVAIWQALAQAYFAVDSGAPPAAPDSAGQHSGEELARRFAQHSVDQHGLEAAELLAEFRVICDQLAEVLSSEHMKYIAESQVAAWLDSLA